MLPEFCPKCGMPVDTDGDETRLCEHCGWFGGNTETKRDPPRNGEFNAVRAMLQTLALHRELCRNELYMESLHKRKMASAADLRQIKVQCRRSTQEMVNTFISLARVLANTQLETPAESGQVIDTPARGTPPAEDSNVPPLVLRYENGLIPWPDGWTDRHYNACNEPCDMLIGPCCCGAWHDAEEPWVRETLARHNAMIL